MEEALESEADVIAVVLPEVLGDTYSELIINLGKLAEHDKALVIVGPSKLYESMGTLQQKKAVPNRHPLSVATPPPETITK